MSADVLESPEPSARTRLVRAPGQAVAAARHRTALLRGLLARPLTSYYLILSITLLLLALGLVMVFTTTTVQALEVTGRQSYLVFEKQLAGVAIGLVLMWTASKCPPRLFRLVAGPLMVVSVIGLAAVLAIGHTVAGGTRWIGFAGIQLQPSEFAKLGFALWGASMLARKQQLRRITDWRALLVPLLPAMVIIALLVLLGRDLGTTFLLVVIFLALLWVIGTPLRLYLGLLAVIAFALLLFIATKPYARVRLTSFLAPQTIPNQSDWQAVEGKYAIGSGGLFGTGLGRGAGSWGWVPESTTDFIFAIIGEELGLIGTLCTALLYAGLAFAGLRVAQRVTDTFMRLAAAAITLWIVGQAMVNIGAVLGVLPITGVPLPLISAGLSSLLVTMAALGILLSFARREPAAAAALAAAGPGRAGRAARRIGLPPVPWSALRRPARPSPAPPRPAAVRAGQAGTGRAGVSAQPGLARSPAGRPGRPAAGSPR